MCWNITDCSEHRSVLISSWQWVHVMYSSAPSLAHFSVIVLAAFFFFDSTCYYAEQIFKMNVHSLLWVISKEGKWNNRKHQFVQDPVAPTTDPLAGLTGSGLHKSTWSQWYWGWTPASSLWSGPLSSDRTASTSRKDHLWKFSKRYFVDMQGLLQNSHLLSLLSPFFAIYSQSFPNSMMIQFVEAGMKYSWRFS